MFHVRRQFSEPGLERAIVPITEVARRLAIDRRGAWAAARVPTLEDAVKAGTWYWGPPEGCVEYLQALQEKYPGLETINASSTMGVPKKVMVE